MALGHAGRPVMPQHRGGQHWGGPEGGLASVKSGVIGSDASWSQKGALVNRWPFRYGASLGIAVLMLLIVATIAVMQHAGRNNLPVGYAAPGEYVFADHCGSCHGDYAEGTVHGPSLLSAAFAAPAMTRDDIAAVTREGAGTMGPVAGLSLQDQADAIAFLRDLQAYPAG
jgi:mono/diheme cytochrome c family protein